MRRMIIFVVLVGLFLVGGTFSAYGDSSLCFFKDLGCMAWYLLPDNQTSTKELKEWSATSGYFKGYNNVIEVKLRFDQQSVDTFRHVPSWNTRVSGFGLEVDIAEKNNGRKLKLERFDTNFPNSSRPETDTQLCDSILNRDGNTIGLIIREAKYIEPNTDYYIRFYLKDTIPEEGIEISPSLQIVADTEIIFGHLISEHLFGGYLDKFQYLAVESDNFRDDGFKIYPDGHEKLLILSKNDSGIFDEQPFIESLNLPVSMQSTISSRLFGVTTLPTSLSEPILNPPDFIVNKLWLETPWGTEAYKYGLGESFNTKAQSKNIGEGSCSGDITGHFYLSKGYKEDQHSGDGAWRRVDSTTTHCSNLDPGETNTETKNTVISEWITEPGIYNIVYCIDHPQDDHNNGGDYAEEHESNNCSTEAVFEVTADNVVNVPIVDFVVSQAGLTGGRTSLILGDHFGLRMVIKNQGNRTAPAGIRSAYYLAPPGATTWQYMADDGTDASELCANCSKEEWTTNDPFVANIAGTWQGMDCANYQWSVAETNEANNCTTFSFEVYPVNYVPTGNVESSSCASVNGWAKDQNITDSIDVHVYGSDLSGNNPVFLGLITANAYRSDLGGNYGFSWSVPADIKNGRAYKLSFYAINMPVGNNPLIGQKNLSCAPIVNNLYPVYRFWGIDQSHFYTIFESEKDGIVNSTYWTVEGVGFYAYANQQKGTVPVYRFSGPGEHFFTTNVSEKSVIMRWKGWVYEGIAFYVYPTQISGTVPVYRLYKGNISDHFLTTNINEKNYAVSIGYAYEGIIGYTYQAP